MGRTLVMGDVHGADRALAQCLQRCGFNNDDRLIFLGDVADGWPETRQCIERLMTIKNLVHLLGNHDFWTLEWMEKGLIEPVWYTQGGKATIESFKNVKPTSHLTFLQQAKLYFFENDRVFVHAGIDTARTLDEQSLHTLLWSRELAAKAQHHFENNITTPITAFKEVFIGHTPVSSPRPVCGSEVWMMDTGAGWSGRLSIMDIDTKEVFTSDEVPTLYPGVIGRMRQ